ncbi:hypothetical protein GHT06_010871 [Daphnia sinensis]|uniref:Uncharacterized protein n=1 Tax=Daphnia sinensis TaxID=1820382 RepID=A0AAD5LJE9_9CRUS|nr:hypothetical protein GHT06_010871 [Daphnia sinensis]
MHLLGSSIHLILLISCWSYLCHLSVGFSKGEQTTELQDNDVEDEDMSTAEMIQVKEENEELETIWTVAHMDDEKGCSNLRERVTVQQVAEPCPDFQSKGDRGIISKYYY